jgi:hypothetical protein
VPRSRSAVKSLRWLPSMRRYQPIGASLKCLSVHRHHERYHIRKASLGSKPEPYEPRKQRE